MVVQNVKKVFFYENSSVHNCNVINGVVNCLQVISLIPPPPSVVKLVQTHSSLNVYCPLNNK